MGQRVGPCRQNRNHSKLWTGGKASGPWAQLALTFPRQIMIFEKGDDRSTTPRLVITARLGSGQGGKTKQRICSLTTTLEPKWPRRNETMIDSMMTLCRYIQECIPHNLHHHINHHPDQKGSRCFIGHDSHFGRVPVERRFRPIAAQRCILKNALPTVVTLKTNYLLPPGF